MHRPVATLRWGSEGSKECFFTFFSAAQIHDCIFIPWFWLNRNFKSSGLKFQTLGSRQFTCGARGSLCCHHEALGVWTSPEDWWGWPRAQLHSLLWKTLLPGFRGEISLRFVFSLSSQKHMVSYKGHEERIPTRKEKLIL